MFLPSGDQNGAWANSVSESARGAGESSDQAVHLARGTNEPVRIPRLPVIAVVVNVLQDAEFVRAFEHRHDGKVAAQEVFDTAEPRIAGVVRLAKVPPRPRAEPGAKPPSGVGSALGVIDFDHFRIDGQAEIRFFAPLAGMR